MDKRFRNYYKVIFCDRSKDMRIGYLKCIDSIKIYQKPCDSKYQGGVLVSCKKEDLESVEYMLRKAERRDIFCYWEQL